MNEHMREYDDLSIISGIGPARQHWLSESLGVNTFRGLALLSVTRAMEQLKADGHSISASELEKWIVAAQEKLQEKQDNPDKGWKPVAVFILEFLKQGTGDEKTVYHTIVHDVQGDMSQKWAGLEEGKAFQWILDTVCEQLPERVAMSLKTDKEDVPVATVESVVANVETTVKADSLASVPVTAAVEPVPAGKELLPKNALAKIAVAQLCIEQPLYKAVPIRAEHTNEPFAGDILSDTPFVLEALFTTQTEGDDDPNDKHYAYRAEFYADNRASGQRIFLGESTQQQLTLKKINHTARLPEVTLLPGAYRIHVLVTVETSPPVRGHFLAPLLYVN